MLSPPTRRILDAYPAVYLACHRRHVRDDEDGSSVSAHQASVLDHLHPSRPKTLSELAEHLGVGRSTMSIAVARLVERGYVASRQDAADRRRVALTLTTRGAKIAENNTVLDPQLLRELVRSIPAAELEPALAGIECLARHARALSARRSRSRR